jgi:hypothetical protein
MTFDIIFHAFGVVKDNYSNSFFWAFNAPVFSFPTVVCLKNLIEIRH